MKPASRLSAAHFWEPVVVHMPWCFFLPYGVISSEKTVPTDVFDFAKWRHLPKKKKKKGIVTFFWSSDPLILKTLIITSKHTQNQTSQMGPENHAQGLSLAKNEVLPTDWSKFSPPRDVHFLAHFCFDRNEITISICGDTSFLPSFFTIKCDI